MSPATARTELKYSIPRNRLIPEPSVLDVLASGSLFKSREGKVEGYAMPLFQASGEPSSQFAMQSRGIIYYFKHGQVYIYDEAKTIAAQLFQGAALAAGFALPGLGELAGGLSTFVEKGGEFLLDKAKDKLDERRPVAGETLGEQAKVLESRGMVLLPGANLVDVEYQVEPGGFLSKETHRLIYTYEDTQNRRARYQTGAAMKGEKSEAANTAIKMAITARMWTELEYLFSMIKAEYAPNFDAVETEMRAAFDKQHGDGTAARSLEFTKEVNDWYESEVKQNGFTTTLCGQRALAMLEPMREVYDRTPVLGGMMQNLRALAAGQTT
jgi:hypothetical protein